MMNTVIASVNISVLTAFLEFKAGIELGGQTDRQTDMNCKMRGNCDWRPRTTTRSTTQKAASTL